MNDSGLGDSPIGVRLGEAVVVRLAQVEREHRALRRVNALLSVGLVASILLAVVALSYAILFRGSVEALETSQLVLRDAEGVVRGVWQIGPDGNAVLALNDRNGVNRLRFSVLETGAPGLSLTDARGRSRVVLALLPEEGGTLVFADDQGNTRAVLGLSPTAAGSLAFLDASGATRAGVGVDEDGDASWFMNERASARPDTAAN